ncbi:translation initiation factor IF-2-like [Panthera pardus]|uniref:Translation initiation factor IF-2-like n=1 Tax=Panthera pardus TaxID=9691 RepID=A0A9W2V8L5_PANPR|nr:translation initiation factor IF-2-like [Panthera pardus]
MALSILWLPGWSGAGASERTPPGVPRRLRGGGGPGSRCTRYPPGRSSGGSGEDLPRRPLRSPRPLALRRSAWLGLPEFADGARGAAAPGPAPGRRPAPGPAHAGPLSGPRPGPRPSAAAPLARSAPRACPQAPAGSAPPPGGSSSSGTRPPRPLGNRLPGARAPPPAPTPDKGAESQVGAEWCSMIPKHL